MSFLNNWLISIARQKQHDKVLVIAEDYATLDKVNERWPGHAVLIPPALEAAAAHKFGSQVVTVNVGRSDIFGFFLIYDFNHLLRDINAVQMSLIVDLILFLNCFKDLVSFVLAC